jgi:NTP pyrophosphatase (non-canonical NTP hydrolase)
MNQDPAVNEIVAAINKNSQWIGQTTRELRDEVDAQTKATIDLANTLDRSSSNLVVSQEASVTKLSGEVRELTEAIKSSATSGEVLSKRMYWLTIVLAVAAIAQAIAAYLQIRG